VATVILAASFHPPYTTLHRTLLRLIMPHHHLGYTPTQSHKPQLTSYPLSHNLTPTSARELGHDPFRHCKIRHRFRTALRTCSGMVCQRCPLTWMISGTPMSGNLNNNRVVKVPTYLKSGWHQCTIGRLEWDIMTLLDLSICLSINLSIFLSIYPSIHLSICLSVYLYTNRPSIPIYMPTGSKAFTARPFLLRNW